MALPIPPSPGQRIPNGPFFYPEGAYLPGPLGPLIVGAGIYIDNLTGTISAGGSGGGGITTILPGVGIFVSANTGGIVTVTNTGVINLNPGPGIGISPGVGGSYTITNTLPASPVSGTVTSVATGPGLTGGPITTSGTIDLANSGVSPGTYSNPTITVDAYGRITLATPGSSFAGGILATSPLAVTSTFPQTVSIAASSTSQAGAVQLNNTTNSTSVTQAATANSVRATYVVASQAQTDATNAAASAAVAAGQAASAQSAATTANSNAATALATALNAQNDATTALATAAAAQGDATTALANSVTAQGTANSALTAAGQKVPCSAFTGLGELLAGTGSGTFTALSLGVNGRVLTANSLSPSGLEWVDQPDGSVCTIFTGVGLAGGPISTSGTISLANTAVIPGVYTNASFTVDAQGRLTAASSGIPGGVTAIVAGTNVTISPGTGTGVVTINSTGGGAAAIPCSVITGKGALVTGTAASTPTALSVGTDGQVLLACAACTEGLTWGAPGGVGTVTNVATGTGLTGGPVTTTGTIALADTAVAPGSYTLANITVDQQGRITAATSGAAPTNGTVTNVATGTGLTGGPITNTGTIALADTAVSAGAYTNGSFTVDAQGRLTAAASGTAPVTAITGTAPIAVTAGTTPVVSIAAGTTSASGAVQLFDGVNSTSTALALTAAQGKVLQDQITALATAPNIDLAGTLDASTGFVDSVTSVGTTAGYTVGAVLPAASATTVNTYVVVTTSGTVTPPGGAATVATKGDWFLASETAPGVYAWQFLNVGFDAPYASTSAAGIVCLSTNALAQTGTDTLTAITPSIGAATYVFNSSYAAKGNILAATAANTPTALGVGTDGQILTACATAVTGLCWSTPAAVTPAIPCACVTGKGALITGTAANTPTALPVGVNGQYLQVNSACTTGLEWVVGMGDTPVGSVQYFAMSSAPLGWLVADGSAVSRATYATLFAAIGTTYGAGDTTTTFNLPNLKGQFLRGWNSTGTGCDASRVFGSTQNFAIQRITGNLFGISETFSGWATSSVGSALFKASAGPSCGGTPTSVDFSNAGTLGFDSACSVNSSTETRPTNVAMLPCIKWQVTTAPSSCGIPCACITGKGALVTGTAADTPVAIPVGTDGQALVACAACPSGLVWTTPAATISAATPTVAGTVLGCTNATNTALGCNALLAGGGTCNIAVGLSALDATTTGSKNVAVGSTALTALTTGLDNTGIGYGALAVSTTGSSNSAVGSGAMGLADVTGNGNVAFGGLALANVTSGIGNSVIGVLSGCSTSTGCYNSLLGFGAGCNLTTGCNNVAIGYLAQVASITGSCQLAIGFSATNNWLTGDSSKNIQPGAGIKDCTGSVGGICEYLVSTGTALKWITPPSTNYRQCVAPVTAVPVGALCTLATVCICTSGNPVQLSAYGDVQQPTGATWGCTFFRRCGAPNTDFRPQFFETGSNLNESIALTYIDNPPAGNYCYALMGCVCTVAPNSANFGETLGPVLNAVELGTVAPGMTPAWVSAGTTQSVGLGATTTAPVPGTTSFNNVSYRQLGPKEWEVAYIFSATGNWANVGNGDYLFTLPNGLRFDTTLPFQPAFQGNVMASSFASKFYMLTGPNVASTSFSNGGNGSVFGAGPAIWDATRWRLMSSDTGNSGNRAVSNAYWGGSSTTQWNVRFQFTSL